MSTNRIAMCGLAGTGKTTVGTELATRLKVPFQSGGAIFADIAKRECMSKARLEDVARTDPGVDKEIDQRLLVFAKANFERGYVGEGRLFPLYVAKKDIEAVTVLLVCRDKDERLRRLAERENKGKLDHECKPLDLIEIETRQREISLASRAQRCFPEKRFAFPEIFDPNDFMLPIETTHKTAEQVVNEICKFLRVRNGTCSV